MIAVNLFAKSYPLLQCVASDRVSGPAGAFFQAVSENKTLPPGW